MSQPRPPATAARSHPSPAPATGDTDTSRHPHPSPLVDPADLLAEAAGDGPGPVLLDLQWTLGRPEAGHEAFLAAHLPGARFLDLDTVLAGPHAPAGPTGPVGGRHPLPDPADLQRDLRRLGLRDEDRVVVYDAGTDGFAAARAWWTLTWAGLSDVRLLDGGLAAWQAAGGAVETGDPGPVTAGDVTVRAGALPVLDADAAAAFAADGDLLDARASARYAGETEPMDPVAGHIPGARSLPVAGLIEDGRYRDAEALRATYEAHGVATGDEARVAAYCGSGVSAAQHVVALRTLGVTAPLYVGSWSDWVSDPSRPVATGPDPRS